MRKCIICEKEKELEQFRKRQIWFSHTCKSCYASQYRTGKPNTGQFKKGHIPWMKGKAFITNKKIDKPTIIKKRLSETNYSAKRSQWGLDVKKRDKFKCQHCGIEKDLHAHHIIPWKKDETKRFDLENGITLCRSCHSRAERDLEKKSGFTAYFKKG